MIPDSVIHEIQDRVNIVDVIAGCVPLRRAGRNFKGLCVFHEERTPSFIVSPEKQIFHCFGCGASGNVFTFLMKYRQMDFREAVQELGDRAGIRVPEDDRTDTDSRDRKDALGALKAAMEFYKDRLAKEPADSAVRKYIVQRGLERETVLQFSLGYSPRGWTGLLEWAEKRYPVTLLEKAGLVVAKPGGGFYDRFRHRLMFPIFDVKGSAIGFGARALDETFPKYLNSPETLLYRKGKHLYGLHWALEAVRRENQLVLVEGYLDTIRCAQAGFRNVAASSGTALTVDQIRLIRRTTPRVMVLFDGDKAGELATLKGLDLLVQEDCEVSVANLPSGLDPDAYLDRFGAERFKQEILERSQSLFDYKIGLLKRQIGMARIEDKVKIAMEMLETLRKIPNAVLQSGLIKRLAGELGISEEALWVELKRKGTGFAGLERKVPDPSLHPLGPTPWERILIGLFLTVPEFASEAKGTIDVTDFKSPPARSVVKLLLEMDAETPLKPAQFLNRLSDDPDSACLVTRSIHEVEQIQDPKKAAADCLERIRWDRRKAQERRLGLEIREAEIQKDLKRRDELVRAFRDLSRSE